jgi:hypothetical protein
MLAGNRPFEAQSATAILFKIVHEPTPPVLETNPHLPEQAQEILNRALAKKPDGRFQTAREMARELERLQEILHRSVPRPTPELQSRLDEMEDLHRKRRWAEIVSLADSILSERPDLKAPWRAYHQAKNELRQQEKQTRLKPEEKSRQMSEIDREIQLLSLIGRTANEVESPPTVYQETEVVQERKDRTIPVSELEKPTRTSSKAGWVATFALILSVAAAAGWLFWPPSPPPELLDQTVFIASEPSGSAIFVNGADRGVLTHAGDFVEIPLAGAEGEVFTIELRKEGYASASAIVTLSSDPPSPIQLSLEPVLKELAIRTEPPGANIVLDGERLDDTTPFNITVPPQEEHTIVVSKEGYISQNLTVAPGEDLPTDPVVLSAKPAPVADDPEEEPELLVNPSPPDSEEAAQDITETPPEELEEQEIPDETVAPPISQPAVEEPIVPEETVAPSVKPPEEAIPPVPAPLGTLSVHSEYPLSILSGGDSLAEMSRDATVRLEAGRQQIILLAPEVFLNQTTTVDVRQNDTTHFYAPQLGRASVRAFPENGMLTIDGIRARDLPIDDLPIVAGTHQFLFQWPNGARHEQTVTVKAGERVYVTGQLR